MYTCKQTENLNLGRKAKTIIGKEIIHLRKAGITGRNVG